MLWQGDEVRYTEIDLYIEVVNSDIDDQDSRIHVISLFVALLITGMLSKDSFLFFAVEE
jgi:hypothetical protein